jgi:hypothetical protein
MGIKVRQNFDWDITKRKIVLFISNFHREKQVHFGIENLCTELSPDDYVIIIGNDNSHYDFDYLREFNAYYFSLDTGRTAPRNSAFIRNYAIKRCQSKLFMHKDPEVFVFGDFLKYAVEHGKGWKAGHVLNLSENVTNNVLHLGREQVLPYLEAWTLPEKVGAFSKADFSDGSYQVSFGAHELFNPIQLHQEILSGKLNVSNWVSYALGIETDVLQEIHGYDEEFTNYGFEDSDMICRLMRMKYPIYPDHRCVSVHMHHPSTSDAQIRNMESLFKTKLNQPLVRNQFKWGEGI